MLKVDILENLFETQNRYHDLLWSLKETQDVPRSDKPLIPAAEAERDVGEMFAQEYCSIYPIDHVFVRVPFNFDTNEYEFDKATIFDPRRAKLELSAHPDVPISINEAQDKAGDTKESAGDLNAPRTKENYAGRLKDWHEKHHAAVLEIDKQRKAAYLARKAGL